MLLNGATVYADAVEQDMYAAIDALADKLDRRVKKHKEKLTDHHAVEAQKQRPELIAADRASTRRCTPPYAACERHALVIVSGLSGSGKSVALHMLEDLDYYCVDNIPAGLLPMFISHTVRSQRVDATATPPSASTRATAPRKSPRCRRWSPSSSAAGRAARCCSCAPTRKCC